ITWPVFLFIWMYASKVMLVFGGDFLPMKPVLQLLALSQVLLMLGAGSAWVLIMTGHPKTALANNIITLTVNVLANLYLIPRYGPLGAALGTMVAVGVLTLLRLVEVGALHRMHPFSWMQLKPLLAGIVALAVCYLANRVIFDWHTVLVLVVGSIIFLAAYVGSLIVLGLQPDDLAVLAAARRKLVRIFL
ncbi:MAG: polysaccharide biosynthesis C-terminal domain-containing protein, partial [Candidatus Marinimicrobia bacterium]|nr:polysaccharide biosynthesis C-terminal domain-containing protein [Candidatus Neomarinimicrobiota bacterium]